MSNNENRPAALRAVQHGADLISFISLVIYAGVAVLAGAFLLYLWRFGGQGLSGSQTVWGEAGDFIGGVSNPVLSFLALMALLMTVRLQAAQLDAAREELAEARAAQEKAEQRQLEQLSAARKLAEAQTRTALAQERTAIVAERQARATDVAIRVQVLGVAVQDAEQTIARLRMELGSLPANDKHRRNELEDKLEYFKARKRDLGKVNRPAF